MNRLVQAILSPGWVWVWGIRLLMRTLRLFSFRTRLSFEAVKKPAYAYCMYHAAVLAKKLGHRKMSVLELGVAGGRGLVAIEAHAREITRALGVEIEIYGFDLGTGLPPPQDYRDLPYHWRGGFYAMDQSQLAERLKISRLIIGDVRDTCREFLGQYSPAPIGAIMFDLDLYSSTKASFQILEGDSQFYLPRVFCYFDDIIGGDTELYNEYTGERLAIAEFNQESRHRKLAPCHHFVTHPLPSPWHHAIYILHDFQHPEYNTFIDDDADQQLRL